MKNENYQQMFTLALEGEGKMLKGYSLFHRYSFFNQMYALWQMQMRGIEISPIAPFNKWKSLNRTVKKGSKAIELCMPFRFKDKESGDEKVIFTFQKKWFAMSQTDGEEVQFPNVEFDFDLCLETLGIIKEAFQDTSGNVQGYAKKGVISINPLAELPGKTFFHEVAHNLLHTNADAEFVDNPTTEASLQEVEAEGVALCVSLALGLDENIPYCRGYIKGWNKNSEIPIDSVKKIFKATDTILKAGTPKAE